MAYAERFGKLSIGSILTGRALQTDWRRHRRERRGIIAYNARALVCWACAAGHFGGKCLKGMKRTGQAKVSTLKFNDHDN
jgi:hypothetical protein